MLHLKDIKKLIRSRSLSYTINGQLKRYSDKLQKYNWKGHPVYYRAGKADVGALYEILIRPTRAIRKSGLRAILDKKLEYWIPPEVKPKVILDIGGNIGTTSVYFGHMFPNAKIYTFEPVTDNFEILQKNTEGFPNTTVYNVGLGKEDTIAKIFTNNDNDNTGGYSLYNNLDVDESKSQEITIKRIDTFLNEIGVDQVDLIKIDTEGAEYDILTTMNPEMLSNTRWIIGELHGEKDFELLAYLNQWFSIDIDKTLRSRLSEFNACNRKILDQIPWKR